MNHVKFAAFQPQIVAETTTGLPVLPDQRLAQNYGIERVMRVADSNQVIRVVRFKVNLDSSYPFQSHVESQVWTPAGWVQVLHVYGQDAALTAIMASRDRRKILLRVIDELLMEGTVEVL